MIIHNNSNSQQGFLLPTVMIILIVLSLLGATSLSHSILEMRMSRHLQEGDQLFYAAEIMLDRVQEKIAKKMIPVECLLPTLSVNHYAKQDDAWWLSRKLCAVNFNKFQARYGVEKIASGSCVHLQGAAQQGVEYYRVTAWVMDEIAKASRVLQTTFAVAATNHEENICKTVREISKGRQSWSTNT